MRRRNLVLVAILTLVVGSLVLLRSALDPGLVTRAGRSDLAPDRVVPGATLVSLRTRDGVRLRGIHVAAPADGPLVLHLLPADASVSTGVGEFAGFGETLEDLRRRGFSSLAVDYRGVGASDGEPDASAIAADVIAMWEEALRRCGGRGDRIILRSGSVGALGVAALLATGARPGAIVMAAPADSATVVEEAAEDRFGPVLGPLAAALYRAPAVPELAATLQRSPAPTLVLAAAHTGTDGHDPAWDRVRSGAPTVQIERTGLDSNALLLRFYGFEGTAFRGRLVGEITSKEAEFLDELP